MTWYNSGYLYKKQITINHTVVSGGANLSNFPYPVVEPFDTDLRTVANGGKVQNANGYDIIFVDATETTLLNFEVENYNPVTGEIEAWVGISTLSCTIDTVIYMYYGNVSISSSLANPNAIWDSNYKAVWHLGEKSGTTNADSTSNGANATKTASNLPDPAPGQIGGGQAYNGLTSYQSVSSSSINITGDKTLEMWINALSLTNDLSGASPRFFIDNIDGTNAYQMTLQPSDNSFIWGVNDSTGQQLYNSTVVAGSWYHLVGTYTASGRILALYINGALVSSSGTASGYGIGSTGCNIGRRTDASGYLVGSLDEIRVSNIVRSAGWIATSYNCQSAPSTFLTFGPSIVYPFSVGKYTLGSFVLNGNSLGLGYFFISKPLDLPVVNPITFTIARRDGLKKSGETVGSREINVVIKVVGSSRIDLISKLDSLQQALAVRGSTLMIHEDSSARYYQNCDCVAAPAFLAPGNVVSCPVAIKWIAYDPYAYAGTSSSYDTGTVALTLASSLWNFSAINITGGGTYYSYPLLHIINKTSTGSTTLTTARNNGTGYTTLPVAATSFSASVGDVLRLNNGSTTQNVTVGTAFSVGATTITVTSFTANATYAIGATVTKVTQWNSIQISQVQDSQTLTTNSTASVPLPNVNGDYVDVQCNPAVGMSIITNSSGKKGDPVGLFPVMEPGTTTFNISISSSSAVSAEAVISWAPRYLS